MGEPTVYDVDAGFFNHPKAFTEAYAAWLTDHGIDKSETYRTEHHVIDAPLIRVFQYDQDDDGRRYYDEITKDAAKRQPFDVLIKTQPPSPEDYT